MESFLPGQTDNGEKQRRKKEEQEKYAQAYIDEYKGPPGWERLGPVESKEFDAERSDLDDTPRLETDDKKPDLLTAGYYRRDGVVVHFNKDGSIDLLSKDLSTKGRVSFDFGTSVALAMDMLKYQGVTTAKLTRSFEHGGGPEAVFYTTKELMTFLNTADQKKMSVDFDDPGMQHALAVLAKKDPKDYEKVMERYYEINAKMAVTKLEKRHSENGEVGRYETVLKKDDSERLDKFTSTKPTEPEKKEDIKEQYLKKIYTDPLPGTPAEDRALKIEGLQKELDKVTRGLTQIENAKQRIGRYNKDVERGMDNTHVDLNALQKMHKKSEEQHAKIYDEIGKKSEDLKAKSDIIKAELDKLKTEITAHALPDATKNTEQTQAVTNLLAKYDDTDKQKGISSRMTEAPKVTTLKEDGKALTENLKGMIEKAEEERLKPKK